jgi:hypothetical protein
MKYYLNYFSSKLSEFLLSHKYAGARRTTLFLIMLFLFFAKSYVGLDPDFGWRLRTGYYILENGVPRTDLYTYTMSSFPWIDHAWPISTSFAVIYDVVGKVGLALAYSLVAVLSTFLVVTDEKLIGLNNKIFDKPLRDFHFVDSFLFVLAYGSILPFVGIRAQVVTWFMFSVLILVLFSKRLWEKYRYLLPVFFLVWGNLHGGFAAGLVALSVFTGVKFVRTRRFVFPDLVVLVLSILATLINPYGLGTWQEVWSSASDAQLRWRIAEWQPMLFKFDLTIIAFSTTSFVLIYLNRKIFSWEEKVLYLFFLLQGITSARNIPLLVIVSLPLVIRAVVNFYKQIKKDDEAGKRFGKVYTSAWIGSVLLVAIHVFLSLKGSYMISSESFYPEESVTFLEKNMSKGRIFSEYGWGGYLIWKLPEKKVFIDGRMPSWRWEENIPTEENDAMKTYEEVLNGETDYEEVFAKYQIDTVLWSKPGKETLFQNLDKKLNKFMARFGKEKSEFDFIETLRENGWNKVHEDETAVIYRET